MRTSSYRGVLVLAGIAGSTFDTRERFEAQIERFAPGLKERILACTAHTTADLEGKNANLIWADSSNEECGRLRYKAATALVSVVPTYK